MTKAMHRIQRKNKFLPYLLTLPSMLLFSMFTFYPFLKTVALSFFLTDKRGNPTKWAGISNWVRVLSKETFWKIIAITLEIAGINLVFTFGLAKAIAGIGYDDYITLEMLPNYKQFPEVSLYADKFAMNKIIEMIHL